MPWSGLGKLAIILSVVFNVIFLVGVTVGSAVFIRTPYSISEILSSNISAIPSSKADEFYISEYLVTTVFVFGFMFPLSLC